MHLLTTSLIISAVIQASLAAVYIVKPDGSDSFNGGKRITVTWLDNDSKPAASAMGPSTLYLATGSTTAHTNLATLARIPDPSKQLETPITFDKSWGPESDQYFILLESDQAKDETTNQPLQAFSARFQLNRMTGTFPAEALAQLDGSSSPPSSGSALPSSLTPSSDAPITTAPSALASSTSSESTSAKNAATSSKPAENSARRHEGLASGSGLVVAVVGAGLFGYLG